MKHLTPKPPSIFPVFFSGYPCRYRCAYCNAAGSSGCDTPPDWAALDRDVKTWVERSAGSSREIAVYGNDLSSIPDHQVTRMEHFFAQLVRDNIIQGIRISIRPDSINRLAKWLDAQWVSTVELGVPSMDPAVLKRIRRGHTPNDVCRAIQTLRTRSIKIGFQTMIGLPESDPEEPYRTARQLICLAPDFVRIHPLLVLKGTAICEDYDTKMFQSMSLDQAIHICADLVHMYRTAGIPVIRLGFHLPEIQRQAVLRAGPYHSAFGQRVRSLLRYREMKQYFEDHPTEDTLAVPRHELPEYIGYQRENIKKLRREFRRSLHVKIC